jgi:hypothetical protein
MSMKSMSPPRPQKIAFCAGGAGCARAGKCTAPADRASAAAARMVRKPELRVIVLPIDMS